MRQQLIQYVDLLFAGAADCEDIKQEILQNTLDRYDDLIAEGKVPQAKNRVIIHSRLFGGLTVLKANAPETNANNAYNKAVQAWKLYRGSIAKKL